MKRKYHRLGFVCLALTCITCAVILTLRAFQENIIFFYTPSETQTKKIPASQKIRIGGFVEIASIRRQGMTTHFKITDTRFSIATHYTGILPDLFREGQGVVAEGFLVNSVTFKADQVLAKHDENYCPIPEPRKKP